MAVLSCAIFIRLIGGAVGIGNSIRESDQAVTGCQGQVYIFILCFRVHSQGNAPAGKFFNLAGGLSQEGRGMAGKWHTSKRHFPDPGSHKMR